MGKKISSYLFLIVTAAMLLIPGITMNTKPNQSSEFDNRMLQEFPSLHIGGLRKNIEGYLSDRVGFREEMLTFNQVLCDKVFRLLVHPSYMYGKDGYVMTNWDLRTYQHLDVDMGFVENFTEYLKSLQCFCEEKGSKFLFFLCPNKETIYPEYFPDGYNIKEQPNRSDIIVEQLKEKDIPFLYLRDYFLELKKDRQLYNVKYDAGHWNDNGNFYGNKEIIRYLNREIPVMGELELEEFEVSETVQKYLPNSHFRIDERVPLYTLRSTEATELPGKFEDIKIVAPDMYHKYFRNLGHSDMPKILIFGDSYFSSSWRFYLNHSSELMLLHSHNMVEAEYYISTFEPDIVIFEAVERVLQYRGFIDNERVEKRFESEIYSKLWEK